MAETNSNLIVQIVNILMHSIDRAALCLGTKGEIELALDHPQYLSKGRMVIRRNDIKTDLRKVELSISRWFINTSDSVLFTYDGPGPRMPFRGTMAHWSQYCGQDYEKADKKAFKKFFYPWDGDIEKTKPLIEVLGHRR